MAWTWISAVLFEPGLFSPLRCRAADKAAEEHGAGEEQEGEEHLQPGIQRGDNRREDEPDGRIRRHHQRHDEKGQRGTPWA